MDSLFDVVIFDLDGTLVATDGFWVRAAQLGAERALRELDIERALPTPDEWMSMVGLPIDQGFDLVFADLEPSARAHLLKRCMEEEDRALARGDARLYSDVVETLTELKARGVGLAIASNCGQGYLDAMLEGLELSRWIDEPLCLDSRGIDTKTDMVEEALRRFDTRNACMVGDRVGDRDAAWANGIPHVHLETGFVPETVEAEATLSGVGELGRLLERRRARARELWRGIPGTAESVRVLGPPSSGKSLLIEDLTRTADGQSVGFIEGGRPAGLTLWVDAAPEVRERRARGRDFRRPGPHREAFEAARGAGEGPPEASGRLLVVRGDDPFGQGLSTGRGLD